MVNCRRTAARACSRRPAAAARVAAVLRRQPPDLSLVGPARLAPRADEPVAGDRPHPHAANGLAQRAHLRQFVIGARCRRRYHERSGQARAAFLFNSFIVGVMRLPDQCRARHPRRLRFRPSGQRRFFSASLWALMLTRMIPGLTLVLPFFIIFRTLGLIDTRLGAHHLLFILPAAAQRLDDEDDFRRRADKPRPGGAGRWLFAQRRCCGRCCCRWCARASSLRDLLFPRVLERVPVRPDPHLDARRRRRFRS